MEAAGETVVREVSKALDPLLEVSMYRDLGRCQPCVVHDTNNNAVWIHIMKGSKVRSSPRACGWHFAGSMPRPACEHTLSHALVLVNLAA